MRTLPRNTFLETEEVKDLLHGRVKLKSLNQSLMGRITVKAKASVILVGILWEGLRLGHGQIP